MAVPDPDVMAEMLAQEERMMGRPCEYIDGWSAAFVDDDEVGHVVAVLVYAVKPYAMGEVLVPRQVRAAMRVDDRQTVGVML